MRNFYFFDYLFFLLYTKENINMTKEKATYICQACGAESLRWSGKCESCGEWNTLIEERRGNSKYNKNRGEILTPVEFVKGADKKFYRLKTGIMEVDQVLGGGLVPGSVTLLGGEPGIGKSTLALQIGCSKLINANGKPPGEKVLYISGEESGEQVNMRAQRLNIDYLKLCFLAEVNIDNIAATIKEMKPALVIIDSVQTILSEEITSLAGSISQLREVAGKLIEIAKNTNIPIIMIGHVTKEGNVAGPKTLEHLVDTVLYLEGDRFHTFRILRSVKNRFGSTNEVGIFEMRKSGLIEVQDPSKIFIEERRPGASGSVVTSVIEGHRSFLLEIQGLTSKTVFGYPKRTASGYDVNRLQLLIAVLSKRANLRLNDNDIYLNIVGGFRVKEPALDLAVCLAVSSSYLNKPIDSEIIILGEVGLSGEVRNVSQLEKRLKEAQKLGFKRAVVPPTKEKLKVSNFETIRVKTLNEAIDKVL